VVNYGEREFTLVGVGVGGGVNELLIQFFVVFNEYIRQSGNRRQLQSLSNRFWPFPGVVFDSISPEKLSKRGEKQQTKHSSICYCGIS